MLVFLAVSLILFQVIQLAAYVYLRDERRQRQCMRKGLNSIFQA